MSSPGNEDITISPGCRGAAPLFGSWIAVEEDTPATYFSVCVAGILEDESEPSTHEGYFTGRWWQSVRWDTDKDRLLRINSVTHWCEMPSLPNTDSATAG